MHIALKLHSIALAFQRDEADGFGHVSVKVLLAIDGHLMCDLNF